MSGLNSITSFRAPPVAHGLRRLLWAGAVVAATMLGASTQHAAAATKTEKTFDSWAVICVEDDEGLKRCSMLQQRIRAQDKRMVMLWSISANEDNELFQSLTVPAGVSIKEGIRLFIGDEDPLTLSYDFCGPRVCMGRVPLTPDLVAKMKGSVKGSASYVQGTKQLMQVNLDLNGFTAAYDYLVEQLSL